MPDIKLFSLLGGVKELSSTTVSLEKELILGVLHE